MAKRTDMWGGDGCRNKRTTSLRFIQYTSALTTSENVSDRSRRERAKFPHSPPQVVR